jgi:integrase
MWSMALRFTEASSIRWADVDLDTRRLTVRKTLDKAGRTWVLPLTDEAANLLRSEQGRARRPDGKIFGIKSVRATLDKICTDPHVTPHHFRHARISEWAANTRDLASVQFMARHMSIATTALYVRSRTEQAERMLQEIVRHKRRGK